MGGQRKNRNEEMADLKKENGGYSERLGTEGRKKKKQSFLAMEVGESGRDGIEIEKNEGR